MSENSKINPIIPSVVGAGLGVGGAALLSKTPKYNLEQLLKQEPDEFVLSGDTIKDASAEQKTAIENIKNAGNEYREAGKAEFTTAADKEIKSVADVKAGRTIDTAITDELKAKKEAYVAKIDKEQKALTKANADLKAKPEDADLKKAAKEAQEAFDKAKEAAKKEFDELKAARKKVFEAKKEVNKKFITDDLKKTIKTARENMGKAVEKRTTALSDKMGELLKKEDLGKDYKSIKGLLPKAKGKAMAIWGGVGLVVGFIASKLFGGNKAA